MNLDSIDFIRINEQTTDFPMHFHDTFCISLIRQGTEIIDFGEQKLYSEQGSISITNPYEIHANPLFSKDAFVSFETIYISQDLIRYANDGVNLKFVKHKIVDKEAQRLFIELINAISLRDYLLTEQLLKKFIAALKKHTQEINSNYTGIDFQSLKQVDDFINHNIKEKFSLEELAKIVNINKYGFAKKFKIATGMSPMNYILMRKVNAMKNQINLESDLTRLAFEYKFSDLSHFSHTFKRYIGVSPKSYQKKS